MQGVSVYICLLTRNCLDLLQQKDSEAVAQRQAAVERARMLSQEREENQIKLKQEKQKWVDKYKKQKKRSKSGRLGIPSRWKKYRTQTFT